MSCYRRLTTGHVTFNQWHLMPTNKNLMIHIRFVTTTSIGYCIQSVRCCTAWFCVEFANDQNKEVTQLIEPSSGLIFKECDIQGINFNNFILLFKNVIFFFALFVDANVARNLIRKYSYPFGCVNSYSLFRAFLRQRFRSINSFILLSFCLFVVSHQKVTFQMIHSWHQSMRNAFKLLQFSNRHYSPIIDYCFVLNTQCFTFDAALISLQPWNKARQKQNRNGYHKCKCDVSSLSAAHGYSNK